MQVDLIDMLGRVASPGVAQAQFTLVKVAAKLSDGHRSRFRSTPPCVQFRHQEAGRSTSSFEVWNLLDCPDLSPSIDSLPVGCLFPPAELPNIRMLLSSSSYDAPILHDDLRPRLREEISSPKYKGEGNLSVVFDKVVALRRQCSRIRKERTPSPG